jgi:hypothetical protein
LARRALGAEALLRGVHRTQGLLEGVTTSGRLLCDLAGMVSMMMMAQKKYKNDDFLGTDDWGSRLIW